MNERANIPVWALLTRQKTLIVLTHDQIQSSNALNKFKRAVSRKFAHLDSSGVGSMVVSDKVASNLDSSKEEYLPVVFVPFI